MYGLPRAGFDWDDEFGCTALFIGFTRIEDTEGSMWMFFGQIGIAVLVIFVDDGAIGDYLIFRLKEWYILKIQDGETLCILGMTIMTVPRDIGSWSLGWRTISPRCT